jgi:hypothetical protein
MTSLPRGARKAAIDHVAASGAMMSATVTEVAVCGAEGAMPVIARAAERDLARRVLAAAHGEPTFTMRAHIIERGLAAAARGKLPAPATPPNVDEELRAARVDLAAAHPAVLKILTITGLRGVFPVHATVDDGLAAMLETAGV